jgi:hypothetical protein
MAANTGNDCDLRALGGLGRDYGGGHRVMLVLGPEQFFSLHGFGQSRSYELIWDENHYPHKAIPGTAYEFATGQRLAPGDFEGGKSGAVKVLGNMGFTVQAL